MVTARVGLGALEELGVAVGEVLAEEAGVDERPEAREAALGRGSGGLRAHGGDAAGDVEPREEARRVGDHERADEALGDAGGAIQHGGGFHHEGEEVDVGGRQPAERGEAEECGARPVERRPKARLADLDLGEHELAGGSPEGRVRRGIARPRLAAGREELGGDGARLSP